MVGQTSWKGKKKGRRGGLGGEVGEDLALYLALYCMYSKWLEMQREKKSRDTVGGRRRQDGR